MAVDAFLQALPPTYIPSGYALRRQLEGSDAAGFGEGANQVALVYTRGWEHVDFAKSLSVYVAPQGAPALAATENHPGLPVDLGISSVQAVYHDGLWAPGSGEMERNLGDLIIHWDRSVAHSITIWGTDGTYAVRASKDGVTLDELIRVATSLRLAG